jgi:hypothetical protein
VASAVIAPIAEAADALGGVYGVMIEDGIGLESPTCGAMFTALTVETLSAAGSAVVGVIVATAGAAAGVFVAVVGSAVAAFTGVAAAGVAGFDSALGAGAGLTGGSTVAVLLGADDAKATVESATAGAVAGTVTVTVGFFSAAARRRSRSTRSSARAISAWYRLTRSWASSCSGRA